ncbi:MAG: ArsA family ATPase [Chloroflexota bacterium]
MNVTYSIGKGGVGKTTCAAALALHCSHTTPTLVVSLDPAHNLGDVLDRRLDDSPREVSQNLSASEIDMDAAVGRYLKHSADNLKKMYGYVKTINLEGYLDALRLSPGIEEYATLEAMEAVIRSAEGRFGMLVFDTPPTGLTLRVLALPRVSVLWGERIGRLRKEILDRRKTISSIHGQRRFLLEGKEHDLPDEEDKDPVMKELNGYLQRMRFLDQLQSDERRSRIMPVMNPDTLSVFETRRAFDRLRELGMSIGPIVVNKVGVRNSDESAVAEIRETFDMPVQTLPFLADEPVGLAAIADVENRLDFDSWVPSSCSS